MVRQMRISCYRICVLSVGAAQRRGNFEENAVGWFETRGTDYRANAYARTRMNRRRLRELRANADARDGCIVRHTRRDRVNVRNENRTTGPLEAELGGRDVTRGPRQ